MANRKASAASDRSPPESSDRRFTRLRPGRASTSTPDVSGLGRVGLVALTQQPPGVGDAALEVRSRSVLFVMAFAQPLTLGGLFAPGSVRRRGPLFDGSSLLDRSAMNGSRLVGGGEGLL